MKKTLSIKCIVLFICIIILSLIISLLVSKHNYNQTIESMLPTHIEYNGTVINRALNADCVCRFLLPKRDLYFGKLPSNSKKIEIIIPGKVTINVYPNDTDSVLISYDPHDFGFTRNYKLSGFGDFNKHLEDLYELTDDEVFNETIDLPEAPKKQRTR